MFVVLVVLAERKLDLNLFAGFVNSGYFDSGAFPAPRLIDLLFIIRNNAVDELADHFRNAIAKYPLCCSTDRQYLALFINGDDGVCRCFLDNLVSVFKLFHCLLSVWTVFGVTPLRATDLPNETRYDPKANLLKRKGLQIT